MHYHQQQLVIADRELTTGVMGGGRMLVHAGVQAISTSLLAKVGGLVELVAECLVRFL